jgi:hypothetical protein
LDQRQGHVGTGDTHVAVIHRAIFDQFLRHTLDEIAGNGESAPGITARFADNLRIYAHDLTRKVEQWPAAVAWIDRRIRLNGATDREILTISLMEAGMVGIIGGTVGLIISYLFQYVVNNALVGSATTADSISIMNVTISVSELGGSLVVIPTDLALIALGLATCIGIVAGLYPSLRAARMTTVVALKTE